MLITKTSPMKKIRTNDLALEINKVSIEDNTNNKESEHDYIKVTQSGDPNNESKPAYKKFCFYCHKNNHGISNCYQKQRDEEYQDIKIRDHELLNNPLKNIFAVNLVFHKFIEVKTKMILLLEITIVIDLIRTIIPTTTTDIEITTDIEATVEIIHKIIIDLTLDKNITIDLQALIIQARIQPFNHQKRHTQTMLMILNHFEFPRTMTP